MQVLVREGLSPSPACTTVFLFLYFSNLSAGVWWCLTTTSWALIIFFNVDAKVTDGFPGFLFFDVDIVFAFQTENQRFIFENCLADFVWHLKLKRHFFGIGWWTEYGMTKWDNNLWLVSETPLPKSWPAPYIDPVAEKLNVLLTMYVYASGFGQQIPSVSPNWLGPACRTDCCCASPL